MKECLLLAEKLGQIIKSLDLGENMFLFCVTFPTTPKEPETTN